MISRPMHDANHTNSARPLVVKLGGGALDANADASQIWRALASIHAEAPGSLILVHGGGSLVDARLSRLGITSERRNGVRITGDAELEEVVATLAGLVNTRAVAALCAAGAPSVGLSLADASLARAVKTMKLGFDAGRVGEITGGSPDVLHALLGAGMLPVIASIGADEQGGLLNINADDAAAGVARIVGARELVLLTDVEGVKDASGAPIASLDAEEAEARIASGEITGGMIPKIRSAIEAANAAGAPAAIASWKNPDNLLRLARGERVGTWVAPSPVQAEARRRAAALV